MFEQRQMWKREPRIKRLYYDWECGESYGVTVWYFCDRGAIIRYKRREVLDRDFFYRRFRRHMIGEKR